MSMYGEESSDRLDKVREEVRDYYGKSLKGSEDLKTNACMCSAPAAENISGIIPLINTEVLGPLETLPIVVTDLLPDLVQSVG